MRLANLFLVMSVFFLGQSAYATKVQIFKGIVLVAKKPSTKSKVFLLEHKTHKVYVLDLSSHTYSAALLLQGKQVEVRGLLDVNYPDNAEISGVIKVKNLAKDWKKPVNSSELNSL